MNEELGRHRGRECKSECTLCGAECESVVHVLWECTAYSSSRASFMEKLHELSGDSYADFDLLEKTSYVLGSEHWEKNFKSLLFLVKEYIVDVYCMAMTHALVPVLGWGSGLELMGRGVVSWTNEVSLSMSM